jgi:hypothetical protein
MADSKQNQGKIIWPNLVSVVSLAILIGTMIVGLGLATGWAIAGALGLGEIGTYVIEALFVGIAAAAIVALWQKATSVEPVVRR